MPDASRKRHWVMPVRRLRIGLGLQPQPRAPRVALLPHYLKLAVPARMP